MGAATADPLLRRRLSGTPLLAIRSVVLLLGLVAIGLFVRGIPAWLAFRTGRAREIAATAADGFPYETIAVIVVLAGIVSAIVWLGLATLILTRRSRDPFGAILSLGFLASASSWRIPATTGSRPGHLRRIRCCALSMRCYGR